jgi:hypothetical protein
MLGTAHQLRRDSTRNPTPAWESVARRAGAVCRERLDTVAFDRHYRQCFTLDQQGLTDMSTSITPNSPTRPVHKGIRRPQAAGG